MVLMCQLAIGYFFCLIRQTMLLGNFTFAGFKKRWHCSFSQLGNRIVGDRSVIFLTQPSIPCTSLIFCMENDNFGTGYMLAFHENCESFACEGLNPLYISSDLSSSCSPIFLLLLFIIFLFPLFFLLMALN